MYKIIDGVLYAEVDSAGILNKANSVVESVRAYKEGIAQCQAQIKEYERQISAIVNESGIDKEAIRILDPEKASFLGL